MTKPSPSPMDEFPNEVFITPESLKRHSFDYVEDHARPDTVRYARTPGRDAVGDDLYPAFFCTPKISPDVKRCMAFDPTLYKDDKTTPLCFTMRQATIISTGHDAHGREVANLRFDHRPHEISRGHFIDCLAPAYTKPQAPTPEPVGDDLTQFIDVLIDEANKCAAEIGCPIVSISLDRLEQVKAALSQTKKE